MVSIRTTSILKLKKKKNLGESNQQNLIHSFCFLSHNLVKPFFFLTPLLLKVKNTLNIPGPNPSHWSTSHIRLYKTSSNFFRQQHAPSTVTVLVAVRVFSSFLVIIVIAIAIAIAIFNIAVKCGYLGWITAFSPWMNLFVLNIKMFAGYFGVTPAVGLLPMNQQCSFL